MSAPGLRTLAAACLCCSLTAAPGTALAAPTAEPASRRSVLLLAASDAEERALEAVKLDLKELVEPIGLQARRSERKDRGSLSRLSEKHHALAAIWLEQSSSGDIVVYVFDAQSQRLGMRRLPRGSQTNAEESVGVVLRATLEALIEGREAPLDVVQLPAEPPTEPVPKVVAPAGEERGSLRTGYLSVGFASDSFEHGASLGAALSLSSGFRVGLGYAILQPAQLASGAARVTLIRRPIDAFASLSARFGWFELFAEAGGSLDLRERRSEVTDGSLRPSADAAYAVVSALGRLKLARELWPQLRLDLGPALEVPLNEPELVVLRTTSEQAVSGWKVRPRIEAGVSLVIR